MLVPELGIASGMLVGMGIGLVGGVLTWLLLRGLRSAGRSADVPSARLASTMAAIDDPAAGEDRG